MREKASPVMLQFPTIKEMDAYIHAIDIACYEVLKTQIILICDLMKDEKNLAISKYQALERNTFAEGK